MKLRVAVITLIVVVLVVVFALATAGQSATTRQPIEGYWTYGGHGGGSLVLVRPAAGAFESVKLAGFGASICASPSPVGHVFFRVSGSGTRYTGGHFWVRNPPVCSVQAYSTDSVLDLNGPDTGQICSSSPWVPTYRECLTLTRGCPPAVGASTGAPVCVGSGSKADARLASGWWKSAAATVDRLRRRLRGKDRRLLRSLGAAFSRYQHTQAEIFATIAKDPPDKNYRQIALAKRVSMPRARPSARRALLRSFAQTNAVGRALGTTIDRAGGARLAGDSQALAAQNAAAINHARVLAALLRRQPRLARRVAGQLRPRSLAGRRLVRQLRAPAFAGRVALSTRVLQAFIAQNS
jgi:hypothetical protein